VCVCVSLTSLSMTFWMVLYHSLMRESVSDCSKNSFPVIVLSFTHTHTHEVLFCSALAKFKFISEEVNEELNYKHTLLAAHSVRLLNLCLVPLEK